MAGRVKEIMKKKGFEAGQRDGGVGVCGCSGVGSSAGIGVGSGVESGVVDALVFILDGTNT
jgi:hypothetical protein